MITPTLLFSVDYWDGPLDGLCEHDGNIYYFKRLEDGYYCDKCDHPKTSEENCKWLSECCSTKKGERGEDYDFDNYKEEDFCHCKNYRIWEMFEISSIKIFKERVSHWLFVMIVYRPLLPAGLWYNFVSKIFNHSIDRYDSGKKVGEFEHFRPENKNQITGAIIT